MIKNIIISLIIIIVSLIFIPNNFYILKIYLKDIIHGVKYGIKYKVKYNNNIINNSNKNYNNIKVLIVSFDNRSESELKYLKFHKENIKKYCKKWKNVDYFFTNKCNENVYWCKLYLIQEKLKNSKYDYIMWMDTDAIFLKNNLSIQKLLSSYSSDIFISNDPNKKSIKENNNILCAGVFIIKNSKIGKKFIDDCINEWDKINCVKSDKKLNGVYACLCYEQGIMNKLIYEKYIDYTTILYNDIIKNTYNCDNNSFILHNFGKNNDKLKCFENITQSFHLEKMDRK
jgi:hypothetical protein